MHAFPFFFWLNCFIIVVFLIKISSFKMIENSFQHSLWRYWCVNYGQFHKFISIRSTFFRNNGHSFNIPNAAKIFIELENFRNVCNVGEHFFIVDGIFSLWCSNNFRIRLRILFSDYGLLRNGFFCNFSRETDKSHSIVEKSRRFHWKE